MHDILKDPTPPPLLGPGDPPPFELVPGGPGARFLLICDHAGRRIPAALGGLGVLASEVDRHIGWDIGARDVTVALARHFDAPAILGVYSRLVVDLNRRPHQAACMPAESDGTPVPANCDIAPAARTRRLAEIYEPYHAAIGRALTALPEAPALVSIHSFTPRLVGGPDRPWDVGVLWLDDSRIAEPLIAALRARGDIVVGDNEPYSGRVGEGGTVRRHAYDAGLPHVTLEIRQDRIADRAGAERWAGIIADALGPILADPALYRRR